MQDSRRRIWQDAGTRRFGSFTELNVWLAERCRALWSEIRHPEHKQFSVADMLEQEQLHLMPMPEPFDGYVESPARVSSTRLYPARIAVVAGDAIVASHQRLSMRGQTCYDWQHYIPLVQRKPGALRNGAPFADLPAALQHLRGALLRHAGGDRIMAQVLAAVPSAGLDAVLVAVELVIESGVVSAEHVINVLGRLNATPLPGQVPTTLLLKQPPQANSGRYDSLRAVDGSAPDTASGTALANVEEGGCHEA